MTRLHLLLSALALLCCSSAPADVVISAGYYDLAPPAGGNTNPLPNPWVGSPNTIFLGNISQATSSDPDESALLITNSNVTPVTLDQGVTITSGTTVLTLWDSLIGSSGLVIQSGQSVILAGTDSNSLDGSDIPLLDSTVSFSLNGTAYSVVDSNSILHGSPIGSANETEPWTVLGTVLQGSPSAPEPGSVALLALGLAGLAAKLRFKARS